MPISSRVIARLTSGLRNQLFQLAHGLWLAQVKSSELRSIAKFCLVPYVIIIDNTRRFGKDKDYPSLEALFTFIHQEEMSGYAIKVGYDFICVTEV